MNSWLRDILGEKSLRLYISVFLVLLLLDFFLGRVLQRVYSPFANVGLVIATFANLLEFVLLISFALIFYTERGLFLRKLISAIIFVAIFLAFAIVYITLFGATSPLEISLLFKIVSSLIIALAIFQRIRSEKMEKNRRLVSYVLFYSLLFAYIFSYYYQVATTLASHYLVVLPFYIDAFLIGEYLLVIAFFFVFVYSIAAPCEKFKTNSRILSRTVLIPTLTVGPLLFAMILNPKVAQYLAMLIVEVLGFAFSRVEVFFFMLSVWFFFTGILILKEKSRLSGTARLRNDAIALVIIFLGGFIFEFVYYFLIGVIGSLLLSVKIQNE